MDSSPTHKGSSNGPEALWRAAAAAMDARDGHRAARLLNELTSRHRDFIPGWQLASQFALRTGKPSQALAAIERALALEPGHRPSLLQAAICELQLGRPDRAESLVARLGTQAMGSAVECAAYGKLLTTLERREEALAQYREAARLEPRDARCFYNMGALARTLGRFDAAERHFDRAIELNPDDTESWKIRSELRRQTPERNHVEALEATLARLSGDPRKRAQLCYALGKELEDLEQWDRSWGYLKRGAEARRSTMRYEVERDLRTMATLRKTFDGDLLQDANRGSSNGEPIFVVGMPRTGTTLVERILSSHQDVHSAGELNHFAAVLTEMIGERTGGTRPDRDEAVRISATLDFEELGVRYIRSTRPMTGQTPRFIDKMPLNFLYLGLIRLALPKAHIVLVERDPLDTCFAVFKQLFVDAYPFSYDLAELGRYFAAYHRLVSHWRAVMPDAIHAARYERIVDDLEGEARRLLTFCGLDWEPACLEFHRNPSASTTASTAQVRQPIYRSSVGRWQRYERHLGPLIDALRAEGIPLGEEG